MSYRNPLVYIIPTLFIIFLFTNLLVNTEQHFVFLAKSFLSGSLSFTNEFGNVSDLVFFKGKYYWPLGPFPAIMIMPFITVFKNFQQGFLGFPITLLNFYILLKIAKKLGLAQNKAYISSIFFIFGSIYTPLALLPASWYFAQVVACTFLILAIYEFLFKKRYLLIGIYVALAVATRTNIIFASFFFLYFLFKKPIKFENIFKFTLPIICILFLLGTYNYIRFKNPFESGYSLQIVPEETHKRRAIGLFSLKHIPTNIYYMLFSGPVPVLDGKTHELKPPFITFDNYGLSLFFLSPIMIFIYKANLKKEILKIAAFTAIVMLIPIVTYYGIGQKQVGYRYALDFFPFIFLMLADALKKVDEKILYPLLFFGVFFCFYFSFLYLFGLDH